MDNHKVKAIIFDLGNVLIDFDHRIAARHIAHHANKSAGEIFELFFDSTLTRDFECGKISPQDFFFRIRRMLGLKISYAQFVKIWNEIFFLTDKNRQVYALAKRLRSRYMLGLLSNINILHYQHLLEVFNIFDPFHKIMTSYELGVQKPDPLIYEKAVCALGVSYQEAFYTDDRPELVEGARKLGMRGFTFKDVIQLEEDLLSQGISVQ